MDFTRGTPGSSYLLLYFSMIWNMAVTASMFYEREYCSYENFRAACAEDEIILVRSATYGRMRIGRCVKENFGHITCSANATNQVHALCSGRRACDFSVSKLHQTSQGCPPDLASYLVADYDCIKGITCDADMCKSSDYLRIPGEAGYIPSASTMSGGCGSVTCPWTIQAAPGQRVNISLLDFGAAAAATAGAPGSPSADVGKLCFRYATLKDGKGLSKDWTVCNSEERRHGDALSYMSTGNTVEITVYTSSDPKLATYFVLKYQVIGCPLMAPPRNAWLQQLDGGGVLIHCNFTSVSYRLRCENTAWVGELGTCSEGPLVGGALGDTQSPAFGMLIIVGLGIALGIVIGVLMLAVTLTILKRRRNRLAARHNPLLGEPGAHGDHVIRYDRDATGGGKDSPSFTLRQDSGFYSREHDYTCTLHLKRALPTPNTPGSGRVDPTLQRDVAREQQQHPLFYHHHNSAPSGGVAEGDVMPGDTDTIKLREHVYETPKFPIQEMSLKGLRIHSADGIARKVDQDEGRSNRTN